MELFKTQTKIDFLGVRYIAAVISGLLIITSIVSFVARGLNFGIDFTGGTVVELSYAQSPDLEHIRQVLNKSEFKGAVVQYFGSSTDVLIRLAPKKGMNNAAISNRIMDLLGHGKQHVEMRRVEFVGAQVGNELAEDGTLAMIYALGGILIYVALRFQMRFSVGAIVALIHDTTITIGFFSVSGMEFDLTVLAAVLAVIGYSLNDTIVVFDRVRENFHRLRGKTAVEVFNISINQTLSRTIMTSFATLLVVFALYFWGGKIIHGFATALMVGIIVGTYSSIYVASPVTLSLGISREDLLPVKKEGAEQDSRP